jgi:hypothetical protein
LALLHRWSSHVRGLLQRGLKLNCKCITRPSQAVWHGQGFARATANKVRRWRESSHQDPTQMSNLVITSGYDTAEGPCCLPGGGRVTTDSTSIPSTPAALHLFLASHRRRSSQQRRQSQQANSSPRISFRAEETRLPAAVSTTCIAPGGRLSWNAAYTHHVSSSRFRSPSAMQFAPNFVAQQTPWPSPGFPAVAGDPG